MGMKAPVTQKMDGAAFEIPAAGKYLGACNGVYMLGTQPGYNGGPAKQQILFTFELHKRRGPAKDSVGRSLEASIICNFTANVNSKLIELAGALENRQYAEEDLLDVKQRGGFDAELLLDKVCWLDLEHEKKANGDTRVVVNSFSKLDPEDDAGLAEQVDENRETDSIYWDWTLGSEVPRRINYWWATAAENPNKQAEMASIAGSADVAPTGATDKNGVPF